MNDAIIIQHQEVYATIIIIIIIKSIQLYVCGSA